MESKIKYAPIDGGFGWLIVVGCGVGHIIIIPVMQTFGLILKDSLSEMNIHVTQFTTIINLNSAIGMSIGILNGPLLNTFGYRKIAIIGGIFYSIGLYLTSFSHSFPHFIVSYSIIASLGTGLTTSSFSLALNTYFLKLRNKAAGIVMTIAGLGPIIFPQLVALLLSKYSSHETLMIMSAVSLNIMVGACLLQPIKWHSQPLMEEPLTGAASNTQESLNWRYSDSESEDDYTEYPKKYASMNFNIDNQSLYGFDMGPPIRNHCSIEQFQISNNNNNIKRVVDSLKMDNNVAEEQQISMAKVKSRAQSLSNDRPFELLQNKYSKANHMNIAMPNTKSNDLEILFNKKKPPEKRWFESGSIGTINLGSSVKIFDEDEPFNSKKYSSKLSIRHHDAKLIAISEVGHSNGGPPNRTQVNNNNSKSNNSVTEKLSSRSPNDNLKASKLHSVVRKKFKNIIKLFDFNLLRDTIYLNILIGISIAIFSEINFSLLTPLILNDLKYSTAEIATFMSVLALSDIIVRFLSPFLGDYFDRTPRIMYMYSLLILIIARSGVLIATNFPTMLLVAIALGFGKGVRSVYMSLVVPSHVPIERLASASGIQMLFNCICLFSLGPVLGYIRDVTGSFLACIVFMNILTCLTLFMWSIEFLYIALKH